MRRTGFIDAVDGLGRHDHVCWAFDGPDEFRRAAGRFLTDGLAAGQRVIYLAEGAGQTDLDHVEGFAQARAEGAAYVQDLGIYDHSLLADPILQVGAYARATEQALADGYDGLRVAADATSLVRTPDQLAAFARYEHLVDVYMTGNPFAAMCGYNRRELTSAAIAEVACMHPLARTSSAPLRLFASMRPGTRAALAGEIDIAGHALLQTALERAAVAPVDGTVAIDARELSFIDHRGLFHLVDHARSRGATAVLHTAGRGPARVLADLLRLPDLQVTES
ncbi:MEDS domain-containing protein [Catellatospora sp. KI3]|uniref:MEDS domain-containing protein n=1 Tax=Catellatospora sp. KI3 TaxID=3041620 RepID=UPI0024822139|nr:MEDS domain-containing protein [Catellatospora sp. KI3]MDI1464138.1 MEDS domain-containing protein [Catellatospora sp. KI3]